MNLPYPNASGGPLSARGGQSGRDHPLAAFPAPIGFPAALPSAISSEQRAELREVWGSILKRKWYILALVIVASLVAWFMRQSMAPVYRAEVSLVLDGSTVRAPGMRDDYGSRLAGDYIQTQLAVIRSRAVAERTARALKLWNHPAVDPRIARPTGLERMLRSIGMRANSKESGSQMSEEALLAVAADQVSAGLSGYPLKNTYILNLSFTHENREVAILVANELATQYVATVRSDRSTLTSESSKQLLDQLVPLREQLGKSEQALLDFTSRRGIVNMGGTGASPVGQQLGSMTDRLMTARADRLAQEAQYQEVRAARGAYASVPSIMRDPSMTDILRQLSAARAIRTNLLETFTAESFRVRQVDEEIVKLQASANAQAQVVAQSAISRYEALRQNEAALERAVDQIRGSLQTSNRDEFELTALQRAVERDRKIFETFMSQVKEMGIVSEMQPAVARVLDPARGAAEIPSGNPNLVQTVSILTLFLGCLGAAFVDRLDNTIKGLTDAESRLGQHVLAALPVRDKAQRSQLVRAFIDEPETSYAEGIRTARTGVMLSTLDLDQKIILVTSSVPGEGKTTVAINLALAHAQTQPTLLIDCDLRRSRVAHALSIDRGGKGLTDLVAGTASVADCVRQYKETGLTVLPVGKAPPNPLEMLVSQRFQDTIAKLSEEYPVIIIDSPPVELVSDALVLIQTSTNIVYVVRAMKTPAPLVRKGLARLRHAGGNVLGVVLNRLDFKAAHAYHGEYGPNESAFGGYGYGNGYVRADSASSSSRVSKVQRSVHRPYQEVRERVVKWVKSFRSPGDLGKTKRSALAPREPE